MSQRPPAPAAEPRRKTTTLRALRRRLEAARARREVAQLRAEARVYESLGGWADRGWDPFDRWADRDGWVPLGGDGRTDRQDGANRPHVWTETDLDVGRVLARWLAQKNRLAIGVLNNLRNYTVRTGYVYEAGPAKGLEGDARAADAAAAAQRVVDEFVEANQWQDRERSVVWRAVRDGEVFLRLFPQADGPALARFVEPEQVRQPLASPPEWSFGVRTDPDDVERVISYAVSYAGPDDWQEVDAAEVFHLKRNVDECVKRGLSDFYATQEGFDSVGKLIQNMVETGGVQAAIAWIEQFDSASAASVAAQIAAARDQNRSQITDPITGKATNWQKYKSGSVVKVGKGRTYQSAPLAANTTQHVAIVQAGLRSLGARWCMPEYMVSGDASNANYASTLVSGAPFVTAVECEQDVFRRYFLRVLWAVVGAACRARRIVVAGRPVSVEEIRRLVDLKATPPQVAIANKAEEASTDTQDIASGVMSKQERRRRRGLDDAQMRREIQEDPPAPPPLPAPPGPFGGGPLRPSLERRLGELQRQYGGEAAAVVAAAARLLLEGGE